MKKHVFILAILLCCLSSTFAQTENDSIFIEKVGGGYQFFKGGMRLNMSSLVKTMKTNELAYKKVKSAQSSYVFSQIFAYAGGFLVGYPLGTAIGGGDPEWAMAGIGAGLIVIGIPISKSYNKKAKEAVDLYNGDLQKTSFWDNKELKLNVSGGGIGLALKF